MTASPAPAPLPREEIERIDRLHQAATPGPLTAEADLPPNRHPRVESDDRLVAVFGNTEIGAEDRWEADAALFAALRNAWPSIKAEIEAGRAGAERVRKLIDAVSAWHKIRDDEALDDAIDEYNATAALRQPAQPAPDMIQQHEKQLADWVDAHPVFGSAHGAYVASKAAAPAQLGAQPTADAERVEAEKEKLIYREMNRMFHAKGFGGCEGIEAPEDSDRRCMVCAFRWRSADWGPWCPVCEGATTYPGATPPTADAVDDGENGR